MRIQNTGLSIAAVASVLLALAGCDGSGGDGAAAASAKPASSEPRYGGRVIIGAFAEPVSSNDLFASDAYSRELAALVFTRLMRMNERLEMEPELAEAPPDVSADGKVFTYHLHHGVKFHDGVELTARDVVFTYRIFKHPDYTGPRASQFSALSDVEAVDDYTVRFTLSEPDARFPANVRYGILPKHLLDKVPVASLGDDRDFNDHPIGAGPFKLVDWTHGQTLTLEANPDYFGGRPYLDGVIYRFIANQSAGVLLLQTGEVDYLLSLPESEAQTVGEMPHVTLLGTLQHGYVYIGWNLRNPLFADKRVRQALAHAVDRQEFVDTILAGHGRVADSPASPVVDWAYPDDLPTFPYDPARAKALLAEAGWSPGPDGVLRKDGRRFSFMLLTNDGNEVRRDLGVIVQQQLAKVGVEVKPAQMEWGAFLDRVQPPRSDFDALILGWNLGNAVDPSNWHSREIAQGLNYGGFSNARVDELVDRSIREVDRTERAATIKEIYRIVADEQPDLFVYNPEKLAALRSDVRGFVLHPRDYIYAPEKWWLDR
jgi:peptide/nickel transport system substrate-binding protein